MVGVAETVVQFPYTIKAPKKGRKKRLVVGNTSFFKDVPKMCLEANVIFILKTPAWKKRILKCPVSHLRDAAD